MIRNLLFVAGLATPLAVSAQTVSDSVIIGPGYANQVYYSLADGPVKTAPLAGWDVAFQASVFGAAIRVNQAGGTVLYDPGMAPADFGTAVDTNGADGWNSYHNADSTWDVGAFDKAEWLTYQGSGIVVGAKMFVLQLADGTYRQFMVDGIGNSGGQPPFAITFRYADIDGSNVVADTLVKTEYASQNFIYYSLATGEVVDQEPAERTSWDLLFTRYTADLAGIPYPVTGVLTNYVAATPFGGQTPSNVTVAEARDVAVETATPDGYEFSDNISVIGYDWKSFSLESFSWNLDDSLAYFVTAHNDSVYRLVFTDFGGSANGAFYFDKASMITTSLPQTATEAAFSLSLAPNPTVGDRVELAYRSGQNAQLRVVDLTGRVVYDAELPSAAALGAFRLPVRLRAGAYVVALTQGTRTVSQRLLVR